MRDTFKGDLMNLTLWIVAGLLAAVMLFGSLAKLFVPKEKLAEAPAGGWTGDASVGFVKTLGAVEILAAIGIVLPAVVDITPVMVPVTAVCWVLLMIGAMTTHLRRHESTAVVANVVYLAMAAFVAWGRFGPESFTG
jgi:hypothetical protein